MNQDSVMPYREEERNFSKGNKRSLFLKKCSHFIRRDICINNSNSAWQMVYSNGVNNWYTGMAGSSTKFGKVSQVVHLNWVWKNTGRSPWTDERTFRVSSRIQQFKNEVVYMPLPELERLRLQGRKNWGSIGMSKFSTDSLSHPQAALEIFRFLF